MFTLICIAGLSAWYLNRISNDESNRQELLAVSPDYYLENFTTTSMNEDGSPRNKVHAIYMAHYPDDDSSELLSPTMEFFRQDRAPLNVKSEKGWLTSDNEVILLKGEVELYELDKLGDRRLQVDTSDARVLPNRNYAETDAYATIVSGRLTIRGDGMRAHFEDSRLEVLSNVQTTILPK